MLQEDGMEEFEEDDDIQSFTGLGSDQEQEQEQEQDSPPTHASPGKLLQYVTNTCMLIVIYPFSNHCLAKDGDQLGLVRSPERIENTPTPSVGVDNIQNITKLTLPSNDAV